MNATNPEADHECCPCVERLRAQNKVSSDAWTKRSAQMQSELDGLRHLMATAEKMNHARTNADRSVVGGMSVYGRACLAAALGEAEDVLAEAHALRAEMYAERRARLAAEASVARWRDRQRPSDGAA